MTQRRRSFLRELIYVPGLSTRRGRRDFAAEALAWMLASLLWVLVPSMDIQLAFAGIAKETQPTAGFLFLGFAVGWHLMASILAVILEQAIDTPRWLYLSYRLWLRRRARRLARSTFPGK